jgi:hypothetical protein
VELSGQDRIDVYPWLAKKLPPPVKLHDLDAWCNERNDKEPARPAEAYTLLLDDDVTLQEFATATAAFTWRGFVHPVVTVRGKEIDFYEGFVPSEASRPIGTSLATLNLAIEGDTGYLTSIVMLDQWKDEIVEDQRFETAALREHCPAQLAQHIRRICDHPRRPCPIGPFLEVLSLLRRIFPERIPSVTERLTAKAGNAVRYRDGGSSQFLKMEGLIEPIEDSMHP